MIKMSALETPTTQALTEWTKIFPKQVTENYASSVTFMKQLTLVAISTITYIKNIKDAFPDDNYTTEQFGGSKLKNLKTKCRDELAQFLSSALTQAFEAFDKKYLHQLALCFYDGECKAENLVEYHVFEYTYNDVASVTVRSSKAQGDNTGPSTKQFTFENVRERTRQLIRSVIVIMQSCQFEATENYDISLRLYYNEDAPEGYQAPGYNASTECDHLQPTVDEAIRLGCVKTPYHRLVASTYVRESMGASHEVIPSQNTPMMSQMEQNLNVSASTVKTRSECSDSLICCPCKKGDADAGPLLTCQYCNQQQHAVCFGLTAGRARHCCALCADRDPARAPTDPRLVALSSNKRESLCMFRRALWECARAGSVCARSLTDALGVTDANAARLMSILHARAVVPTTCDTDLITPQKVSTENLKLVMNKFFLVSEEENIVDRLVAETFASQERQPDPVGDVLDPLEKVSLQNASNPGKVIKNYKDHQNKRIEDPTLKQYKEAILSNYQMDEDLPLSGSVDPIKDITNLGSKKTSKRKINENNDENKPRLKAGVKTKRTKTKE